MRYKVKSQPFTSKLHSKDRADFNVQLEIIVPPVCNNNDVCDEGETLESCPSDCTPATPTAHIITDVITVPGGDLQPFNFVTTDGAEYNNIFSLTDGTSSDQPLAAGTYSISENAVEGWNSLGVCFDQGNFVSPSSIAIEADETISCTFFNFKNEEDYSGRLMGHIIVFKKRFQTEAISFSPLILALEQYRSSWLTAGCTLVLACLQHCLQQLGGLFLNLKQKVGN